MKSIMDLQKDGKEVQAARDLCRKIYQTDIDLFDRAGKLRDKLALGGLWNGADLALAEIIKTLQREERYYVSRKKEGK